MAKEPDSIEDFMNHMVSRLLAPLLLCALIILAAGRLPPPTAYAGAAADLLPDLAMAPLRDIRLDQLSDGTRRLRFTAEIINIGSGPLEVRGERPSAAQQEITDVRQRVADTQGGRREIVTTATMVFGGDGHNHWHVRDLEQYLITPLDGATPLGTGAKSGFCFFDNNRQPPLAGAPGAPVYLGCGASQDLVVDMGLSVGWGDVYLATLPDQYIDITSLPPGRYRLTAIADPSGWLLEQDDANNTTSVDIVVTETRAFITTHQVFLSQVAVPPATTLADPP
jgi:Lysyl oxidase